MGGKKGGGGASPKEAPETGRSKQLVKIVEVISEGEVEGFANGEQSIFFDNTPLRNANGTYNFSNTEWQARDGQQHQAMLNGFTTTEKEVSVSTEVKKAQPITRTVTDGKVHRIRLTLGVSSLFHQNDNGDTHGTQVDFKITVGNRVQTLSINGKYSSQYLRNVVIDNLPAVPFQIKVERVQADSTSQRLQNKTIWASYTEIIDNQFTYPNTALIGIKFDSEYFASIPTRTYDIKGIKVQVPSNYNPETRQYSGLWDGSFKIAWTDNPAWILYDIVTGKRYGLGQRLGEFGADKWALYQVAQYCDQLVPDGFGKREPRFTCNVWLTEQRSAYDVINDICSIFRAMPVWNGTTLTVIQDSPADPVWTYTNANVIGGFSRQYSAMKARHNAIQVEYKDKDNNYETTIEYVSDDTAIRKYGLNLKKVQAFGCTSRGQAYRTGKWILETERLETETITFSVGAEGLMHLPGDIIRVADSHYAGTEIGGRVLAVNGRQVTLDREIQINGTSHLSFINDNAQHSHIRISSVRGNVVTLVGNPTGLEKLGVWSLTTQQITARLYRAMSIAENDDGSYTITALQHEPQKEAIVDNGASFEPRANTLHQMPKIEHLDVAVSAGNAGISWQTGSGSQIVSYDVKILKDGKLYALHKGLKTTELDLSDLPNGDYQIIIISRNASGQIIDEKSKTFTIDRPPAPKEVQVLGGLGDVMISWQQPDDFTETEIWASETDNIRSAKRVARVMANTYSHTVGAKQVRYYWVRHARGQNLGVFYQEAGLKGETGADIDKELELLNEKLGKNIIDEVFDTAAPARGLELVKTVNGIQNPSVFQQANLLFNTRDNRLYKWNGAQYVYSVPAADIVGNISPTQLAAIPATKITGTISKAQIDGTLTNELSRATAAISQANANISAISGNLTTLDRRLNGFNTTITQQGNNLTNVTRTVATLNSTTTQQAVEIGKISANLSGAISNITKAENALSTLNRTTAESLRQLNSNLSTNVTAITANISTLQNTVAENNRALTTSSEQLTARLDNLAVGGRNLLRNTRAFGAYWYGGQAAQETGRVYFENGEAVLFSQTRNYSHIYQFAKEGDRANHTGANEVLNNLENGDYTFSFDAKADRTGAVLHVGIMQRSTALQNTSTRRTVSLSTDWARYSVTLSVTRITDYMRSYIEFLNHNVGAEIRVRKIKMEKGTIATDWTPAPEDLEQNVANISAELTAYKSAQTTKEAATATQLSGLTARMNGAESNITAANTAIANETQARTRQLNSLQATIGDVQSNIVGLRTAFTSKDNATAEEMNALEARVNNNISANVSRVSQAVTNLNGTVSAMHTIKAQTVSGGRTAIAGIQLNAHDKESSLLVMADKFEVVAGNNGAAKPMFAVRGSGASAVAMLNGDLIATGAITADKIATNAVTAAKIQANSIGANHIQANAVTAGKLAANSVTAAAIQAGAIRADHLSAGQISADKLAVGLGGNLLHNPIFAPASGLNAAPYGWKYSVGTSKITLDGQKVYLRNNADKDWGLATSGLPNETVFSMRFPTTATTDYQGRCGWFWQDVNVLAGQRYIASVWLAAHRGNARLVIEEINAETGEKIKDLGNSQIITEALSNARGGDFANYTRVKVVFTAPASGKIRLALRLDNIKGQAEPWLFARRPMLEEAGSAATEPSPWQNAGVTAIHGGSIATNSITATQIAANTITGNEIVAGTIATKHLAANSVSAKQLAANAVTADKMNVGTLSAISSNIGTVTAGTIKGTTITGNTISGGTISGATISGTTINGGTVKGSVIEGGTIKAAHLEGATGSFSGTLTVNQLIGSNIIEVVKLEVNFTEERQQSGGETSIYHQYTRDISIAPSSVDRFCCVLNSDISLDIPKNQRATIPFYVTRSSRDGIANTGVMRNNGRYYIIVLVIATTSAKTVS